MKILFALSLLFLILLPFQNFAREVNILLIAPENYGANLNFNYDCFENYGWNITVTGTKSPVNPCPWFDRTQPGGAPAIRPDVLLSEIDNPAAFDAIAIMPTTQGASNPAGDLLASPAALQLLRTAVDSQRVVYATCSGVRVLAAADVIRGKEIVGHNDFVNEYMQAGAFYMGNDQPPLIDGNIVTSVRDMYYSVQNSEAIFWALEQQISRTGSSRVIQKNVAFQAADFPQTNPAWSRIYGGTSFEAGRALAETPDGGLIVTGYTYSDGAGFADLLLLKISPDGALEWAKTFGGSGWEEGNAVVFTPDNGFLTVGFTSSFGAGARDLWLVKTDAAGKLGWTKTIGGSANDAGHSLCVTPEGDFVIVGYTESEGAGQDDIFLVKINSGGTVLWRKTFGGHGPERGRAVAPTREGGFIVSGTTGSFSTQNLDYYLIKTDANGDPIWSRNFNTSTGHGYDNVRTVYPTRDHGFLQLGDSDCSFPLDLYLVKTDSAGNRRWAKNFGNSFYDYGTSICEMADGNLLILGATKSLETRKNDLYLLKLDSLGNLLTSESLGGAEADWGSAICELSRGGYAITGYTASAGAGKMDVWVMKLLDFQPKFSATPTVGKPPLEVHFQNQSLGKIVSCRWDFQNDGTFDSDEPNPTWTYTAPGNYPVKLEVSNGTYSAPVIYSDFIKVIGDESALMFPKQGVATIPAAPALNFIHFFTVEAWIYPAGWGAIPNSGFGRIFDKTNLALFLTGTWRNYNDHSLCVQTIHDAGSGVVCTPANSIQLNAWQHVALTCADSTIKIYLNGIEQNLTVIGQPAAPLKDHADKPLYLGNNSAFRYAFDGLIDEVRCWNVVRTPEEIQVWMHQYLKGDEPGLAGYWKLNEGEGAVFKDNSVNALNGALEQIVWYPGFHLDHPAPVNSGQMFSPGDRYRLYANYPNPFNPETRIQFELPRTDSVSLKIFDIQGRLVRTLLHDQFCPAGAYERIWDGRNQLGQPVSSGEYLCRLETSSVVRTQKMLLLK